MLGVPVKRAENPVPRSDKGSCDFQGVASNTNITFEGNMDEETTRDQLKHSFPGIEEDMIIQCLSLCRMFNKTPEDLRYKWEAITFNSSIKDTPISFFDASSAKVLEQHLQRDVASKRSGHASVAKPKVIKKVRQAPQAGGAVGVSPATSSSRRQGGVKVELSARSLQGQALSGPAASFIPPRNVEAYTYRYMHEKVHDRAAALDDQIDEISELVKRHYKLEELGDPSTVTQDEVIVVGRIVNDGDTKLGETSTLFESSRMMGMGARVPLEFDPNLKIRCASKHGTGSTGIGLFPGMLVALKGRNGSGESFVVSEILRLPPALPNIKTDTESSLKLLVSCGPYTFDSDLEYRPFEAIVDAVRNERPQVLLLIGPFVDANHTLVKTGQIDDTPASIFRNKISAPLTKLESEFPELTVILVPSLRDLVSNHVIFPQASLERSPDLSLPRRCHLVPNPSTFSVNGLSIGVTSVDVLFHIRKDEFFKQASEISDTPGAQSVDAMTMLCRQIVEQQSFYPIFPVPKEVQEDLNLSVTHSNLLRMDPIPDLLILPSRLKEFQKMVDSTVVVNPALAAKFNSAGTAACLNISRSPGTSPQCSMKVIKLGT